MKIVEYESSVQQEIPQENGGRRGVREQYGREDGRGRLVAVEASPEEEQQVAQKPVVAGRELVHQEVVALIDPVFSALAARVWKNKI